MLDCSCNNADNSSAIVCSKQCSSSRKTDHLGTRTEIHLLPVHDRHTHTLSRNTNRLQGLRLQTVFIGAAK